MLLPYEVDVHCVQYFVNSSLAPVVLFLRRHKSVAHALKVIRDKFFTQSRWDALLGYCEYVVMVRVVLSLPLLPGDKWIPPDLHGFYRWVFDSLESVNEFLEQVVVRRGVFCDSQVGFLASGGFSFSAVRLAQT